MTKPCDNPKIAECRSWPHHCSIILHGSAVSCNEDEDCVCGEGTCPDKWYGRGQTSPTQECRKKVSTCYTWPHHCSITLHGPSVSCDEDFNCVCGDGVCADENGVCAEPTFDTPGLSARPAPNQADWGRLGAVFAVGLIAPAAISIAFLGARSRRQPISASP